MEKKIWNKPGKYEIRLIDLLWRIAYGWRLLLVMVVVFALVVSGGEYLSAKHTTVKEQEEKVTIDSLKEQLTDQEQQDVELVKSLEKQKETQESYQKNSILMNIDAYQKNVITLLYYVDTHYIMNYTKDIEPDYTESLINAYISYVENNGILEDVCKKLGEEDREQYIGELITVGSHYATDGNQMDVASLSGKVFAVYITGKDMDEAGNLADAVADSIEMYQSSLGERIGSHTLTQLDRYESVVSDNNLAIQQSNLCDTIVSLETRINTTIDAFTPAQKQIYEDEDGFVDSKEDESTDSSFNKKYIVLGAIVGLFFACCWISIMYILGRKIKNCEELEDTYGIRIFGELTIADKKKKLFDAVDRWIDKLQHKEQWTAEEQKDLILANITATCKKEAITQVFLTTSLHLNEQEKKLTEELMEAIRKEGITVTFGENVARNAKSLEQMSEIAEVILIERTGITEYTSLEKELNLCVQQKADVLGTITLI